MQQNRIVISYDFEDLVLIGAVNNDTGEIISGSKLENLNWSGPVTEVFPYQTMQEALSAPPRRNREGFVVFFPERNQLVKIKQQDYIELHKIVTGLNARTVWQAMMNGTVEDLIAGIPDEFHDFVRGVQADIQSKVDEAIDLTRATYNLVIEEMMPDNGTKKDFALIVKNYYFSWALFNLWDGKDISQKWLELYKPAHDFSPLQVSNDAD